MRAVETWVLRIADSKWTWIGLNWLKRPKESRWGFGYVLFLSVLLGLPGIGVGAAMLYATFGKVSAATWFWLFIGVTLVELLLHAPVTYFWNRRADRLIRKV